MVGETRGQLAAAAAFSFRFDLLNAAKNQTRQSDLGPLQRRERLPKS
jgi:hypothetical protein